MCRYRAPDPNKGSSLYTAPVEPGGAIFLWGFGAMYTEPGLGGVFVRRYDFAPKPWEIRNWHRKFMPFESEGLISIKKPSS